MTVRGTVRGNGDRQTELGRPSEGFSKGFSKDLQDDYARCGALDLAQCSSNLPLVSEIETVPNVQSSNHTSQLLG